LLAANPFTFTIRSNMCCVYEFHEFISILSSTFYSLDRFWCLRSRKNLYSNAVAVKIVSLAYFCIVVVYFNQLWVEGRISLDAVHRGCMEVFFVAINFKISKREILGWLLLSWKTPHAIKISGRNLWVH